MAKSVLPLDEQEPLESRRLWRKLTQAIKMQDQTAAQVAKSEVEDAQRALRAEREQRGEAPPEPRFFTPVGEHWYPKLDIDNLPQDRGELEQLVRQFIFGGNVPGPSTAGSATPRRGLPAPAVEVPPVQDAVASTGQTPPAPVAGATAAPVAVAGGASPAPASGTASPAPGVAAPAPGVPPSVAVSVAPVPPGLTPASPTNPGPPA